MPPVERSTVFSRTGRGRGSGTAQEYSSGQQYNDAPE